ncbi:MAG TPA: cation:proton antiporter, partial [Candidatus Didemnitutus sp.]|nr:cation:proton antiporter [Candidatus Didemnitutus sp.]
YSIAQLIGFATAVTGAAVAARFLWVFGSLYAPNLKTRICSSDARFTTSLVIGWAGMRGTVTLAAALSIPLLLPDGSPFPGRDIVIFLAFGVIAMTLLLQGTTLEWLIHRLGLREDDTRAQEERLARITAVEAGLSVLRAVETAAETPDHGAALGQVIAEYEHRLAVLTAEGESRRSARRRRKAGHHYRSHALEAERKALDELWRSNKIADEVYRPLQQLLDHEEAMLHAAPPPKDED